MTGWLKRAQRAFRATFHVLLAFSPTLLLMGPVSAGSAAQEKPTTEVVAQVGHSKPVTSVAFSPDGRTALSGSYDKTLKLWDVATGKLLRTLGGHTSWVNSVEFSRDGRTALSGSADDTIKLWDLETGKMLRTFEGHSGWVLSVALSPDGRTALSGDLEGKLKFWELTTGKLLRTFDEGHARQVNAVAVSPDGRTALSGSDDKTLRLWDVETGRPLRTFEGHSDSVSSVAFSQDGRTALSGSADGTIKLWDVLTGKLLRTFEGHTDAVLSVTFAPDGRTLLSGDDKTLRVWDAATGDQLRTFELSQDEIINSISVSPDGRKALSGGFYGTLKLWDAATGKPLRTFEGQKESVNSVVFSPDGGTALSGDKGSTLKLWDLATGNLLRTFEGHSDAVLSVAFSPDGHTALSGSMDQTLKLWDVATGKMLRTFEGHSSWVLAVALSPDGRTALSGDFNGILNLWDVQSGRLLHTLARHESAVTTVTFSPDGLTALSGGQYGSLELWDIATGKLERTFRGPTGPVLSVAFSPGGRTALSGDGEGLRLWDVAAGELLRTFEGHTEMASSVVFSPDGRTALSGDWEGMLKLWDVATGKLLRTLIGHSTSVTSVAFSPDGRSALSGGDDNTARLWSVATGQPLGAMIAEGKGDWLTITPAGFFAASSSDFVNVVRGLDIYSVAQVYDSLYRPDLVQEALRGDPEGKYKDAASKLNLAIILDSGPAPQIKEQAKTELINDAAKVTVRLTDAGGGIGDKLVWRVNGVTQGALQTAGAQITAGDGYRIVSQTLQVDPTRRNVIEIAAYNGKGLLASLPYHLEIDKFGETNQRPRMFIVAVGVSHYANTGWSLQYAAVDATAIGDRLRDVAKPLYAEPKVVPVLEGAATAKGIEAAIDGIAGDIKPADVFVLYIAGHGRSIAGDYYFLPQDLTFDNGRTIENAAVSQDMLQKWLAKVPAQKSILILDTCESAFAIRGDVEQETAIDRLQHATGRSVITAASDAAHEGYEGHGLLTGAILDALTKSAAGGGDQVTLQQVANYAFQHVPEISQRAFGERQQPHVRLGDDFPLGVRVAVAAQSDANETIPKTPTHVLIRSERVRQQPADDAFSSRDQPLQPGEAVRVVKLVGGFSLIARDGEKLGYVPSQALAVLKIH